MTKPMTLAGPPRAVAFPKLHDYKQNVQKMKGLLKNWVLTGKQFENFKRIKTKTPVIVWRPKQKNDKTPRAKTEHEPCRQEEINWSKTEKNIQNKTVGSLQD